MEVQGAHGDNQATRQRLIQARRDYLAAQISRARAVRDAVHSRTERSEPQGDRIELSLPAIENPERERHVAELAQAHREGTLNSPERIERAATRLLGGGG